MFDTLLDPWQCAGIMLVVIVVIAAGWWARSSEGREVGKSARDADTEA